MHREINLLVRKILDRTILNYRLYSKGMKKGNGYEMGVQQLWF